MPFLTPVAGQPMLATQVAQFSAWLSAAKLDSPAYIAATSTTEYVATFRSQTTSPGYALRVQYGLSSAAAVDIATFNATGVNFGVPVSFGSSSGTLTLTQVTTLASAPGAGLTALGANTNGALITRSGATGAEQVYAPNPLSSTGGMIYSSAGATQAQLGIGSAGALLNVSATGIPAWLSLGATGSLLTAGATAASWLAKGGTGALLFSDTTGPAYLAPGGTGALLTIGAGATAPTWLAKGTTGSVLSADATGAAWVSPGSTSQVLTMASGVPVFASLPAGALPAGDGTVTAPTISFSNSTTTGLYLVTAGSMGMATGGVNRATLSSAGLTLGTNLPITPGAVSGTPAANSGYQESLVKGWSRFDTTGSFTSPAGAFNVSSISDNGAGDWTVNWNRDFAHTGYAAVVSAEVNNTHTTRLSASNFASGTTEVYCHNAAGSLADPNYMHIIAIGPQ